MTPRRPRKPSKQVPRDLSDLLYPTLDLHGKTADEAAQAAARWLESRQREGDAVVRLITGKGKHSVGPAVLPLAIEDLLRRLKSNLVQDYEREPGGGAFRIRLRRPSRPAPPREPPALDPELVRLAEARLAELGIAPTPILLEAEVRRIIREREEN
jgi:hypothetical protein